LIVIAASVKGLTEQEAARRHKVLDHLRERSYTGMPMAQILSLLGEAGKHDAEAIQIIREMDRDLGKETLLSQLSATMDRPDRMNDLKTIQCPVLIIGASHAARACCRSRTDARRHRGQQAGNARLRPHDSARSTRDAGAEDDGFSKGAVRLTYSRPLPGEGASIAIISKRRGIVKTLWVPFIKSI
jgi:hypothetical protein